MDREGDRSRVFHHGAKHTEPSLGGGDAIATTEIAVDPGLDVSRTPLAEADSTDGLEEVIFEDGDSNTAPPHISGGVDSRLSTFVPILNPSST